MKSIILCEGGTDLTLIQYFMEKANNWQYDKQVKLFKLKQAKQLKNNENILIIGATGGCSEIPKYFSDVLESNRYSVDAVYDGEEALEYLEMDNYDGVILDIMMPKIDGITVLKTIRSRENFIPVLLLTAKSEVDDKVEGLDAGANDYLAKPFHAKELGKNSGDDKNTDNTGRFEAAFWKCDIG